MDIRDFGGEFRLIDDIVAEFRNHHGVPLTVGDDAAVVPSGQGDFRVLTTDALVEGEHFKLGWSTPYQIGVKTLECNASDVAAMGAVPEFLLLNLVIRDGLSVEFVREIYRGIRERCDLHGITLLGGDTTKGPALMLSATLTGRTKRPVLRSGAKVGDLICVTGDVGGAAAACALMKLLTKDPTCIVGERNLVEAQFPRLLRRHAEPHCRLDASSVLGPVANAMIDVSDGVASEVRHVCNRSGVGALIDALSLPVFADTQEAARGLGVPGFVLGLSGGEDYELLCTLPPDALAEVQSSLSDLTVIGRILPPEEGMRVRYADGREDELPPGFHHF